MKALRLVAADAPLEEVELPDPVPGLGEAVVRVVASGICRSDVHYRRGDPKLPPLPRTLGHEVAGVVADFGAAVDTGIAVGDRVGLHYLVSCGVCAPCIRGREQFCVRGEMLGNTRDGGYAEYVTVPAQNLVAVPDDVDLRHAAVAMCSSATVFHALTKARLQPGDRVAVIGMGGLGSSAVQLAQAMGAGVVYAVDTDPAKIAMATAMGAVGVDARRVDVAEVLTGAGGVDVALELVGLPETTRSAVGGLAPFGRAAIVGLAGVATPIDAYRDLILKEAEIVGVSDHLRHELPVVLDLVSRRRLVLDDIVSGTVALDADEVNSALDRLAAHAGGVRTVITP